MSCEECQKRDKEIARLRGEITFHKQEQESWRKLYEEQRGGEVFNAMQRELSDVRCELISLKQNASALAEGTPDNQKQVVGGKDQV